MRIVDMECSNMSLLIPPIQTQNALTNEEVVAGIYRTDPVF